MFVVDDEDAMVYAWKMSDQMRDMETKEKDIDLDGDNADPEGLWFDGRVLWVVDDADDRVYVYDLPGAQPDNTVADGVPGVRTPHQRGCLGGDTDGGGWPNIRRWIHLIDYPDCRLTQSGGDVYPGRDHVHRYPPLHWRRCLGLRSG